MPARAWTARGEALAAYERYLKKGKHDVELCTCRRAQAPGQPCQTLDGVVGDFSRRLGLAVTRTRRC